ncbi:MAG: M23 family metallopeptidase, partial [Candidatus Rokuibacteriota bacterium]
IKADLGMPILAAAAGTVLFSGWEKYYGRMVKVEHENGFVTVYAHNLQNFVETGEAVRASQVIATVGRTGRASAYHLHFEIWNERKVFNPLFLLPQREVQVVPDGESQQEEAPEAND